MEIKFLLNKAVFSNPAKQNDFTQTISEIASANQLIFIVGVPRSGSTLLEQIISCNDMVLGLGETTYLQASFPKAIKTSTDVYELSHKINNLSSSEIQSIRESYFKKIDYHLDKPRGKIIIDKLLANFEFIGLIKRIFPEAKIINTRRDYRSSAWSSFKINFTGDHVPYSYSFADLKAYYQSYNKFMDLWDTVYPGEIYHAHYEALVTNPEQEIKQLINFLGLEWTDNYLNFHLNKRGVQTASILQVREKLYTKSLKSWTKYEEYLTDLLK